MALLNSNPKSLSFSKEILFGRGLRITKFKSQCEIFISIQLPIIRFM
jgi:hypothetical protein